MATNLCKFPQFRQKSDLVGAGIDQAGGLKKCCLIANEAVSAKKMDKPMYYRFVHLVPRTGFEPAHLAAPPPEDGASTNFATWASVCCLTGCKYRKSGIPSKKSVPVLKVFFTPTPPRRVPPVGWGYLDFQPIIVTPSTTSTVPKS